MTLPHPTVKICSLRHVVHADWVVAAGADQFGLIFAPHARRLVAVDDARLIVARARSIAGPVSPRAVGVFLDQSAAEINQIADAVGLDAVQILTHARPVAWEEMHRPAIPVFRTAPDADLDQLLREIASTFARNARVSSILLDAFAPTVGGAGVLGNWTIAAQIAKRYPVILAGGLNPTNVTEAIAAVHPSGVDVSSGVETDNLKDRTKIDTFVKNARQALAECDETANSVRPAV